MSIRRQFMIFTSLMVVLVMALLYGISSMVFDGLQKNTAFNYLKTTSHIAEELIDRRLDQMSSCSAIAVQAFGLSNAFSSGDKERLNDCLLFLRQSCPYLSFALFANQQGGQVAALPGLKEEAALLFSDSIWKLHRSGASTLKTKAVIPLENLFAAGTEPLTEYEITLSDGNLLGQALANLTITAVGDSGYLIAGEILNNSGYYPGSYSATIDNSYLSISLGNIRVCSNISSPERDNYLGCPIPDFEDNFTTTADYYHGVEYAPIGGDYYFSYKAIRDYSGEIIGYLGVGIPERDYKLLLKSNRTIILAVILISLPIILIGSWLFCSRITRPIIAGKEISQKISRGDFSAGHDYPVPSNPRSEPEHLIVAINEMADKLRENKTRLDKYVGELRRKSEEATVLSGQLLQLNEQLEAKVDARTLELRQTVTALKKSNIIKSRFLANMSHELRTPLTNNIAASELLLDEIFGPLNGKQAKYINNILVSSNNLLQLINDILDTAKIEAGKTTINPVCHPVREVLDEVFSIVKNMAEQKESDILIKIKPKGLRVTADKMLLKQVLYNLLSNAIKFSDPGKKIWIEVEEKPLNGGPPAVYFSVRDEGIGIDESDLDRVFVEFEQVDNSYSKKYEGTGLGLPLSRKQVELHGGKLNIYSKPGKGTEAIFYIPVITGEKHADTAGSETI